MKNKKAKTFGSKNMATIPVSPIDALIKKLDVVACEMETKWGTGVLHALCTPETSAKFIKVAHRLDDAIASGDYDHVKRESEILMRGWKKMEEEAIAAGHGSFPKDRVWYVSHPDAELKIDYIICQHDVDARRLAAMYPQKASSIFTLKDVAEMIKRESLPENLSRDKNDQLKRIFDNKPVMADLINDEIPF